DVGSLWVRGWNEVEPPASVWSRYPSRLLCIVLLLTACSSGNPPSATTKPAIQVTATVPVAETAPPEPTAPEQQPAEVAAGVENPPEIDEAQVPGALLTNSRSETQEGMKGAYCWEFPVAEGLSRGVCGDPFAVLVPEAALVVEPNEPVTFTLEAENPQQISMRVLAWQLGGEIPRLPAGTVVVDVGAPLLASGELDPVQAPMWRAPPEPGEYVLDMNAVFEDGSVAYGWHIVVQ
ncbi:MAG: hypothetical protein ACRDIB_11525, partial [Ardenticatenaceae bacterium]